MQKLIIIQLRFTDTVKKGMDVLKWWFVAWDSWAKTKARDRELTAFPSASTALQTKSGLVQSKS